MNRAHSLIIALLFACGDTTLSFLSPTLHSSLSSWTCRPWRTCNSAVYTHCPGLSFGQPFPSGVRAGHDAVESLYSSIGVKRQATSTADLDVTAVDRPSENKKKDLIGTGAILLPSTGSDSIASKFGPKSPVGNPSLKDAAAHLARKAYFFSDGQVEIKVITVPTSDADSSSSSSVADTLKDADVLIALGLTSESDLTYASNIFRTRRMENESGSKAKRMCQFSLDCKTKLDPTLVGPYDSSSPSLSSQLLPWTNDATGRRMVGQMSGLFNRWTSDDFTVALMIFFNQFSGKQIDWVKHSIDATWEKGPIRNAYEIYSMFTKCGDCISRCVADPQCRECLGALTSLDTRDQVASYRTIVSYESDLLKDFSFCILQKNNIFQCDATIPTIPVVKPMTKWRGKELTTEDARSILIAHLDDEDAPEGGLKLDVSWKVACGANVAYDQFPSQNQLFYKSVNGRDMWYDPVFRVETIDGRNVWAKRHYKVRNGPVPGTFRFSFLDNGITSNEFWTIVGAADDLSWIVFHYAGAAGAVGQRYLGGLLCTPDGSLPKESDRDDIWKLFRSAGIEPWELYVVDNDENAPGLAKAGPAPLDFYRKSVLEAKEKKSKSG